MEPTLQKTPVHFFPLLEHRPGPGCGDWREGHSWTVVTGAVTCPRCRLVMALVDAQLTEPGTGIEVQPE